MSGAVVLFGVFAVIGVGLAGFLLTVPWRGAAVVVLAAFLLMGGCTYVLTDSRDRTTVLEEFVAVGGAPPQTRAVAVPVAHPGAEHELRVQPVADGTGVAAVDLHVVLTGPDGRVLHDERETLSYGCSRGDCEFRTLSGLVRPPVPGPHELSVTVEGPGVAEVRVAVFDEQETGGERAPGY